MIAIIENHKAKLFRTNNWSEITIFNGNSFYATEVKIISDNEVILINKDDNSLTYVKIESGSLSQSRTSDSSFKIHDAAYQNGKIMCYVQNTFDKSERLKILDTSLNTLK